jgi:two-component system sensor histidine kinase AlgZ
MEKRHWNAWYKMAGGTICAAALMLQPLLENAGTWHTMQANTYGRAEGDQVVVTIANPVAPEGSSTSGHGMALDNIRERLRLAFGSRASLLTYDNNEQFYAVLSLPLVQLN